MKKYFKTLSAIAAAAVILVSFGSCQKEEQKGQTASFCLTYTITTDNGREMPGTKASGDDVFDEFYQKIQSGELVAPTYDLVFTEKTTGAVYAVSGTWAEKNMITLRTGNYKVVGTSTASGENIQEKCSLTFDDDVTVDVSSTTITLKAAYDCSLIIFSDASIEKLSNFNGVCSTDLYKFSNYIYAFINGNLWAEGKQNEAYLLGTHTNASQFKIYTGNLNYETGKYYVYNDIATAFIIEKMEAGDDERILPEDKLIASIVTDGNTIYREAQGDSLYIIDKDGFNDMKAVVELVKIDGTGESGAEHFFSGCKKRGADWSGGWSYLASYRWNFYHNTGIGYHRFSSISGTGIYTLSIESGTPKVNGSTTSNVFSSWVAGDGTLALFGWYDTRDETPEPCWLSECSEGNKIYSFTIDGIDFIPVLHWNTVENEYYPTWRYVYDGATHYMRLIQGSPSYEENQTIIL